MTDRLTEPPHRIAKVDAMCTACLRGYVYANPKHMRCLCGGPLIFIEPVPNEPPYCCEKRVAKFLDGTRPQVTEPEQRIAQRMT